jgi:hypothetical protein
VLVMYVSTSPSTRKNSKNTSAVPNRYATPAAQFSSFKLLDELLDAFVSDGRHDERLLTLHE